MRDQYYGVIEEKYDDRDYIGEEMELKRSPRGTDSFVKNGSITYDQRDVSANSCTVHGAMTAYSALTGYEFTLDERKEIWQEALNRGASDDWGWYIHDAVHLVYEYVNNRDDLKSVSYRRYDLRRDEFGMALRLGYVPVLGFSGNKAYQLDRDDNSILDSTTFGSSTYGHCLSGRYLKGSMYKGYSLTGIIDNYPPRSTNFYKVPSNNWKTLVNNGVFFRSAYIYLIK